MATFKKTGPCVWEGAAAISDATLIVRRVTPVRFQASEIETW